MPLNPKSLFDPRGTGDGRPTILERGTPASDRGTGAVGPFEDPFPPEWPPSKPVLETRGTSTTRVARLKTAQGRPLSRKHAKGGAPTEKHFPIKYKVDPLLQPSWNACFPTAMLMLLKWKESSFFFDRTSYRSDLESEVVRLRKAPGGLRTRLDLENFCKDHGFSSSQVDIKPEAFETQLKKMGPFGYIAKAGGGFQHTFVITGIERSGDTSYILYNNPAKGRRGREEFYEFFLQHWPDFTQNPDKAFIVSPFQKSIQQGR